MEFSSRSSFPCIVHTILGKDCFIFFCTLRSSGGSTVMKTCNTMYKGRFINNTDNIAESTNRVFFKHLFAGKIGTNQELKFFSFFFVHVYRCEVQ